MFNRNAAKRNARVIDYSRGQTYSFGEAPGEGAAAPGSRLPASWLSRGQAMVEFAMIATVAIIVMVVGVQFAMIG
ncbi:MAG: hypothetical protein ACYDBH_25335, partial [Acidobacteriaceae bacterium]